MSLIYLKVQWDEGRLLVIGGREFSYSGTHFNGDVTDVQVKNISGKKKIMKNKIWPTKDINILITRMIDINDITLNYWPLGFLKRTVPSRCSWLHNLQKGESLTKVHLAGKNTLSLFGLLQRLQGDIASWERLDGWEPVGKVEQLTMRSVCICQAPWGVLWMILEVSSPILKVFHEIYKSCKWSMRCPILKLVFSFHVHPGMTTSALDADLMVGRGCWFLQDFPGPVEETFVGGLMMMLILTMAIINNTMARGKGVMKEVWQLWWCWS